MFPREELKSNFINFENLENYTSWAFGPVLLNTSCVLIITVNNYSQFYNLYGWRQYCSLLHLKYFIRYSLLCYNSVPPPFQYWVKVLTEVKDTNYGAHTAQCHLRGWGQGEEIVLELKSFEDIWDGTYQDQHCHLTSLVAINFITTNSIQEEPSSRRQLV